MPPLVKSRNPEIYSFYHMRLEHKHLQLKFSVLYPSFLILLLSNKEHIYNQTKLETPVPKEKELKRTIEIISPSVSGSKATLF